MSNFILLQLADKVCSCVLNQAALVHESETEFESSLAIHIEEKVWNLDGLQGRLQLCHAVQVFILQVRLLEKGPHLAITCYL